MKEKGQKILIVDDSPLFVNRLTTLLRESGATDEIFIAGTFDSAMHYIAEIQPDLIFLDIHLQRKSGIDLLKIIRLSGWKGKVIMLTNETKKAYRVQCERLGSFGYLDKSNDFETIPGLIRELA